MQASCSYGGHPSACRPLEYTMKFTIQAPEGQIDALAIQRALLSLDAGLMISLDLFTGRLRVAGGIEEDQVLRALNGLGYRAEPFSSSECCGGCS